jgi:hypothetical protein
MVELGARYSLHVAMTPVSFNALFRGLSSDTADRAGCPDVIDPPE